MCLSKFKCQRNVDLDSSKSLRFILVDKAIVNSKSIALLEIMILECFHMIGKLSLVSLDEEDRKIDNTVEAHA